MKKPKKSDGKVPIETWGHSPRSKRKPNVLKMNAHILKGIATDKERLMFLKGFLRACEWASDLFDSSLYQTGWKYSAGDIVMFKYNLIDKRQVRKIKRPSSTVMKLFLKQHKKWAEQLAAVRTEK